MAERNRIDLYGTDVAFLMVRNDLFRGVNWILTLILYFDHVIFGIFIRPKVFHTYGDSIVQWKTKVEPKFFQSIRCRIIFLHLYKNIFIFVSIYLSRIKIAEFFIKIGFSLIFDYRCDVI